MAKHAFKRQFEVFLKHHHFKTVFSLTAYYFVIQSPLRVVGAYSIRSIRNRYFKSALAQIAPFSVVIAFIIGKTTFLGQY